MSEPAPANHLLAIRVEEMAVVRDLFRPGARLLELGGGNGLQARILSDWGFDVTSIDVADSGVAGETYFPVQIYDGRNIPAESDKFDHVFSSNVLEHVRDLAGLNREISRVLVPAGTAIHMVPSSTWRLWTSVAHYAYLVKYLITREHSIPCHAVLPGVTGVVKRRGFKRLVKRALLAGPHGEFSSAFAELYGFSRRRWLKIFRRDGFDVIHQRTTRLFYTGYGLLPRLSMARRRALASILGSSCTVLVMKIAR